MKIRNILAAFTALGIMAMGAPMALAEDVPEEVDVSAEDVCAAPVEEEVAEVEEMSLDGSDDLFLNAEGTNDATAEEEVPEDADPEAAGEDDGADEFEEADPKDFIVHCPDVCDDSIRNLISPSLREYPEPLVWPLEGQQPLTNITSHVGWRNAGRIHRRQGGTWASWLHHGIDVGGVDESQRVVAAAGGVAWAGYCDGTGNYVIIDHRNGWYTRYQHLSRFAGDIEPDCAAVPVKAGDPIGYVGSSGGDYPVHFHFEIVWSPDGPGADVKTYQTETSNRSIHAYSFAQEQVVTLRWAETWEICTAEAQRYLAAEG